MYCFYVFFLPLLYIFVCLFLAYLVVLNRVSIRWYLLILLRGYRCFMIILNKNLWYFSVVFRLVIFVIVGSFFFVFFGGFSCILLFSLEFVLVAFLQIVPLFRFLGVYFLVYRSTRFSGCLPYRGSLLVFWVIY